jgi:putative phosphoesterase
MRLAIISDTHIPAREATIPEPFRERIAAADHTIHAGDFQTADVLEEVRELASELTAVHGNIDPPDIGLPTVADVAVEDRTFVVTHGTTNPVAAAVTDRDATVSGRDDWKAAIADTALARSRQWDGENVVGVGGHLHQVIDDVHEGVRVLNPGSVTGAEPADRATMQTVEMDGDSIDVTTHEL